MKKGNWSRNGNRRNRQTGVGMIEVLITTLVLAIGLLGVAALQGVALQGNQVAYNRTQATNVAYELADLLRSNHGRVCEDGDVSNVELWAARVAQLEAMLPGGAVSEDPAISADCLATITVTWTDDRSLEDPEQWTFTYQVQL